MKLPHFFLVGILLISNITLAHTGIKSSSPSNQEQLNSTPKKLTLNFKSAVKLVKLSLVDKAGVDYNIDFTFKPKDNSTYQYTLPVLPPSIYTVSWTIMGKDMHKKSGEFNFIVSHTQK